MEWTRTEARLRCGANSLRLSIWTRGTRVRVASSLHEAFSCLARVRRECRSYTMPIAPAASLLALSICQAPSQKIVSTAYLQILYWYDLKFGPWDMGHVELTWDPVRGRMGHGRIVQFITELPYTQCMCRRRREQTSTHHCPSVRLPLVQVSIKFEG